MSRYVNIDSMLIPRFDTVVTIDSYSTLRIYQCVDVVIHYLRLHVPVKSYRNQLWLTALP